MLDDQEVQKLRSMVTERRAMLEAALSLLADLDDAIRAQELALERYDRSWANVLDSEAIRELATRLTPSPIEAIGSATTGKPNVQVYEEVILDAGRPLHPADITIEAKRRGVVLAGKIAEHQQVRNSLATAPKRFYNIGSNRWWVVGHPLPAHYTNPDDADGGVPSPRLLPFSQ